MRSANLTVPFGDFVQYHKPLTSRDFLPPQLTKLRNKMAQARFRELQVTSARGNKWELRLHSDFLQKELGRDYPLVRGFFATYSFDPFNQGYEVVLHLGSKFCRDESRIEEIKLDSVGFYRHLTGNNSNDLDVMILGLRDEFISASGIIHREESGVYHGTELHLPIIRDDKVALMPVDEYYGFAKDFYSGKPH